MRCIPTDAAGITLGVDTHKDFHLAVALDGLGSRIGTLSIPTTPAGYEELVDWANGFGPLEDVGIEGTGSFGAGLTRFLQAEGAKVLEVVRPKRRDQYRSGKSDPIDAELALGNSQHLGSPKEPQTSLILGSRTPASATIVALKGEPQQGREGHSCDACTY
jgi:transposase